MIASVLRLLGDETRLRILALLGQASLNVTELTGILGLAQSGISRNLRRLKEAGLVEERKEGIWSYYQLVEDCQKEELQLLHKYLQEQIQHLGDQHHDQSRLAEVLAQRQEMGPGLNERLLEPGQSWLAWSRLVSSLVAGYEVADLGCGDGTLTVEMGRFATSVTAVDHNASFIDLAKQRVAKLGLSQIRFLNESMESLSIRSESMDVVFFCQSLHHTPQLEACLQEAFRILKPQGRLLLMELDAHQQTWVQESLGHHWTGFQANQLSQILENIGFNQVFTEVNADRRGDVFRVLLASAIK